MATAPELSQDAPQEVDDGQHAAQSVDYEAKAKELGWTPKDQFKGDESRWIDAETFVKRGEEFMPILKSANKRLERELADMKKTLARASEHFSKAEERAYTRALAEIEAKRERAVEDGDMTAFRAADQAAKDLAKERPASEAHADDAEQRAEDFADWGKANKWYGSNPLMAQYADAQADLIAKRKGGFLDRADLDAVSEKVKAKFAEDFPDDVAGKAAPRRNPVEGVSSARRTAGNTYADLPPEAKATCDKWVKSGLIKSRDDYVKTFDFKGWNNGR